MKIHLFFLFVWIAITQNVIETPIQKGQPIASVQTTSKTKQTDSPLKTQSKITSTQSLKTEKDSQITPTASIVKVISEANDKSLQRQPSAQAQAPSSSSQLPSDSAKLITDLQRPAELRLSDILPSGDSQDIIKLSLYAIITTFIIIQLLGCICRKKTKKYTEKFQEFSQRSELEEVQDQ